MEQRANRGWRVFWACLLMGCLGLVGVNAAMLLDLDAYVFYSILQNDGMTPLADGSWVQIIGTSNNVADPMLEYGTNLIVQLTGDDVLLGTVKIGANVNSNGTFFTTVQYDPDEVKYVYIRFFDTTGNITGLVYWGTSTVFQLGVTLGVATVQFDPAGSLIATNLNNFVVIPEPSTGNLILLVAGMIFAMRMSMRRKEDEEKEEAPAGGSGS